MSKNTKTNTTTTDSTTDTTLPAPTGISEAFARLDDATAIETLLAPVPPAIAADVREGLQEYSRLVAGEQHPDRLRRFGLDAAAADLVSVPNNGFRGMRHDTQTKRAYFFIVAPTSDGAALLRLWVFPNISFRKSAKLWMEIDKNLTGGMEHAIASYTRVTGIKLEWAQ